MKIVGEFLSIKELYFKFEIYFEFESTKHVQIIVLENGTLSLYPPINTYSHLPSFRDLDSHSCWILYP